jgi:magnesium-transporting ATPase (P-type)
MCDVDAVRRRAIEVRVDALGDRALRVLAFARKPAPGMREFHQGRPPSRGFSFLGLQAMADPPREEAIHAIDACHQAGIRVMMITGDHGPTARAIAEQVHLTPDHEPPRVVTGTELAGLDDAEFLRVVIHADVLARVSAEQKLRIVVALQSAGHVVAVTGDGINDAPALKQADIGVAMGVGGTEVAKESADMILTDDDFATIEAAVEEGRGVFDNLTKFIAWTLPTNIGEGLVILAAIVAGTSLPILPVQILWINMTTAVALGLMLAFEPREPDIMTRPPRAPSQPILTGGLVARIVAIGVLMLVGAFGLFRWSLSQGSDVEVARTVAVNAFVAMEIGYLFS